MELARLLALTGAAAVPERLAPRLEQVKELYRGFDVGHDRRHVEIVVERAIMLAKKYAPTRLVLAEIAAVYHDIGLQFGRDDHENTGAEVVLLDPILREVLTHNGVVAVSNAVREHRASTGRPHTMLEKVIADADRSPLNTPHAFMRAYAHGRIYHPELKYDDQLRRAANHIVEKYGPDGYGRVIHFEETEAMIKATMQPILTAHAEDDLGAMQSFLDQEEEAQSDART